MQMQNINNNYNVHFGVKNTFLNRAKNARNIVEEHYWQSLHYEAKARLNYQKFTKVKHELRKYDETRPISLFKVLSNMAYRKFNSLFCRGKAYGKFPNRFAEPDNLNSAEERFYKIK